MDTAFEILLPINDETTFFEFQEPYYEWEGVKYNQGPPESIFHSFKLQILAEPAQHVVKRLPNHLSKITWKNIVIIGDGLSILQTDLLAGHNSQVEKELLELLEKILLDRKVWVLVFEPDNDRIDEVINGTIDEVFKKIKDSLAVEKRGFVAWHQSS